MKEISIQAGSYSIFIGNTAFKALNRFLSQHKYDTYFILCDENTFQHCLPTLIQACPKLVNSEIFEIESGEQSKSIQVCSHMWQTLIENKADKNALIINLGGGVVSDLGGFMASVYKRGLDFIHLPTTLLAMADASVGGKTGIDFLNLKNVIGTFTEPKAVFIYPPFLNTLPERHLLNGIVEIYKIALVADKQLWKRILDDKSSTEDLIIQSIVLKNKIVKKDPKDKGVRKILNFGHTIGHALESAFLNSADELLHGEAILIGMLMESHLSYQKKFITNKTLNDITKQLSESFFFPFFDDTVYEVMMQHVLNDKKNKNGATLFSLITDIGQCKTDVVITPSQIKKAFAYYNSLNQ